MKSFFTQLVLIAGLSVLAVSCGGSKGSGSSNNGVGYSNLSNQGLSVTGTQALAEANAWYAGVNEGTSAPGNVGNAIRTKYTSNSQSNCSPKTFLGMTIQWCTSSSSSGQGQGTVVSTVCFKYRFYRGQTCNSSS